METYEDLLQEFEALLGKDAARSERRKAEIVAWMEANGDEGAKRACEEMIMRNLGRIDGDIATIRQQLGNRYDILPMAYIAEHYFGKSRAWLYQRINGHKVRGKVYTLNEEQKRTFNEACQDLAKEIGSFRLA